MNLSALAALLFLAPTVNAQSPSPSPVVAPTVTSESPSPLIPAEVPLTAEDKKKLVKEFKRAQSNEERAIEHQERSAQRELGSHQSSKSREFREREKRERHHFFETHLSGSERREYIQKYLVRKKAFDQSQKEDWITFRASWKSKRESLKQTQKDKEKAFGASLEQGKRPGLELWPQAH